MIALVVAVLVTAAVLIPGASPTALRWQDLDAGLDRHADRMGLPLPRELRGPIVERLLRRERGVRRFAWGGLAAGTATGLVLLALRPDSPLIGTAVFAVTALARVVGGTVEAWRRPHPLGEASPPAAREADPSPDDYSTQLESTGVWAAFGVALIAPAVAWMTLEAVPGEVPAADEAAIASLVAAVAAGAAWAVLRGAEHAVAHRPHLAADDVELAWDDADRSAAIRSIREITAMLGAAPAVALLGVVLALPPAVVGLAGAEFAAAFWTLMFAGGLALVCALGPYALVLAGRSNLNPSLRLWRGTDFGSDPR